MHSRCQVDVPMDRILRRQLLRSKGFTSDRRHAFVELEKAGQLKEASSLEASLSDTDMNPVIDNIAAASGSRSKRGRPHSKAYLSVPDQNWMSRVSWS